MHLTIIVNRCNFNGLFNGKLSSVLNIMFMKSLPYSSFLPPSFIVSISFLIPSQSSVYFSNTSLFSSVESKTKYLLSFFSLVVLHSTGPSTLPNQIQRIYTLNVFKITTFFNCNVSNIVNINVFVQFFVYF